MLLQSFCSLFPKTHMSENSCGSSFCKNCSHTLWHIFLAFPLYWPACFLPQICQILQIIIQGICIYSLGICFFKVFFSHIFAYPTHVLCIFVMICILFRPSKIVGDFHKLHIRTVSWERFLCLIVTLPLLFTFTIISIVS